MVPCRNPGIVGKATAAAQSRSHKPNENAAQKPLHSGRQPADVDGKKLEAVKSQLSNYTIFDGRCGSGPARLPKLSRMTGVGLFLGVVGADASLLGGGELIGVGPLAYGVVLGGVGREGAEQPVRAIRRAAAPAGREHQGNARDAHPSETAAIAGFAIASHSASPEQAATAAHG